jgi:UDP-galactopyranose mutase
MNYDYLVVGSGLFGSVFAYEAKKRNKRCLVLEKRSHIGGNIYTEKIEDINVHKYGAHIFHTKNKQIWDYINQFAEFNNYINSPIAIYKDELYNLPFNMNTFSKMWGICTPLEAHRKIAAQIKATGDKKPENLEEQALRLVGRDVYEKLIKGYTEKQWGRLCTELPASIIKRLPVRYTYDNNYFDDRYQGIPIGGYTQLVEKMLAETEVRLNTDFLASKEQFLPVADKIIFTGPIDAYYDYCYGELEYRSLRFETEVLDQENYQGNAVVNYTGKEIPYTRIVEHKHFEFGTQPRTVITHEYPRKWEKDQEPYYTINDEKNMKLYNQYEKLSKKEKHIVFGGRLGSYQYYDMDEVIEAALALIESELR